MAEATAGGATAIHDLPDMILKSILASMIDTRARNGLTLVDWKRLVPERGARTSLTLHGNAVHSNPNHSVHQTAIAGDEVRHPSSPPLPSLQDRATAVAPGPRRCCRREKVVPGVAAKRGEGARMKMKPSPSMLRPSMPCTTMMPKAH